MRTCPHTVHIHTSLHTYSLDPAWLYYSLSTSVVAPAVLVCVNNRWRGNANRPPIDQIARVCWAAQPLDSCLGVADNTAHNLTAHNWAFNYSGGCGKCNAYSVLHLSLSSRSSLSLQLHHLSFVLVLAISHFLSSITYQPDFVSSLYLVFMADWDTQLLFWKRFLENGYVQLACERNLKNLQLRRHDGGQHIKKWCSACLSFVLLLPFPLFLICFCYCRDFDASLYLCEEAFGLLPLDTLERLAGTLLLYPYILTLLLLSGMFAVATLQNLR